jgi:hypothetical protein
VPAMPAASSTSRTRQARRRLESNRLTTEILLTLWLTAIE